MIYTGKDDPRLFAIRLRQFNRRMYFRRIRDGILEPAWTDRREDDIYLIETEDPTACQLGD